MAETTQSNLPMQIHYYKDSEGEFSANLPDISFRLEVKISLLDCPVTIKATYPPKLT